MSAIIKTESEVESRADDNLVKLGDTNELAFKIVTLPAPEQIREEYTVVSITTPLCAVGEGINCFVFPGECVVLISNDGKSWDVKGIYGR